MIPILNVTFKTARLVTALPALAVMTLAVVACGVSALQEVSVDTEAVITRSSHLPTSTSTPIRTSVPTVQPAILEARRLTLEWPGVIRVGDGDIVRLVLDVDSEGNLTPTAQIAGNEIVGETVFVPNLYDTHNVLAESRLDMAGMQVVPSGDVSEPLRPGQSVIFYWSVRPEEAGTYRGIVWLHLRFIPLGGGVESRRPFSAQLIEIRAANFLGLGGNAARVLGGVGTVVGSVTGLDNVLPWLWKRLKRRKILHK